MTCVAQPVQQGKGHFQVPLNHPVGEGVVVYAFVVLIGTNNITDFITVAFGIPLGAAAPINCCVQDNLGSLELHPLVITRRLPIVPNCISDVSVYVEFNITTPDADWVAIRIEHPAGSNFVAGAGTLPSEHRPFMTRFTSLTSCPVQGVVAVG